MNEDPADIAEPQCELVEVLTLLEDVRWEVDDEWSERDIEIALQPDLWVYADYRILRRLVTQLLERVLKHANPEQTVLLNVTEDDIEVRFDFGVKPASVLAAQFADARLAGVSPCPVLATETLEDLRRLAESINGRLEVNQLGVEPAFCLRTARANPEQNSQARYS